MTTVQSLVLTADLIAKQGGIDPMLSAGGVYEAWRNAKDWHWSRLALLSGQPIPNLVVRELVLDAFLRRTQRGAA